MLIDRIVSTYNHEDKIIVEQSLTVIYAGMIAEENKKNAILKKRIKRLGIHQVLILNMPAREAAKFSYGRNWRELDAIMSTFGF
jgi:bifunctional pyridoxal-dependent enzyme with beta-cystathionase and maltose regulon repressor activities